MRTAECCQKWAHDCVNYYLCNRIQNIENIRYFATNVHANGNKLYSYSTPICIFENGAFIYSLKNYSRSTSKHQTYMRIAVINESTANNLLCYPVDDINRRSYDV